MGRFNLGPHCGCADPCAPPPSPPCAPGMAVAPHFDAPYLSTSLADFWSRRWVGGPRTLLGTAQHGVHAWRCAASGTAATRLWQCTCVDIVRQFTALLASSAARRRTLPRATRCAWWSLSPSWKVRRRGGSAVHSGRHGAWQAPPPPVATAHGLALTYLHSSRITQ